MSRIESARRAKNALVGVLTDFTLLNALIIPFRFLLIDLFFFALITSLHFTTKHVKQEKFDIALIKLLFTLGYLIDAKLARRTSCWHFGAGDYNQTE